MATTKRASRNRAQTRTSRPFVYGFDQFDLARRRASTWDGMRALLGGKGANLGEMTRLGLPVPPGFTVTTEACRAFLAAGEWPKGLWEQELEALSALEDRTGKLFGDPAHPLLVSCRSGAKFSMPGMMDTVLNLGLNEQTLAGIIALTGNERFGWDAYRRFIQMFGRIVMGIDAEKFDHDLEARKATHGPKASDT
ncbi:MAG TPA: PEP/pyruvate-binding domain-containing protein, partial [Myxococcaceae bacterium]|nr:PEP/pyruvate-binding domain-containing protein [Myxococcaceae bacterium]